MNADGHGVGVVFVNFHSQDLIVPRAERLRGAGIPVVVVDNSGSYPSGIDAVLDFGVNLGFGTACNRGVSALPADVTLVCFHNPDVDIDPVDIMRLAGELADRPNPGLLAPTEKAGPALRPRGYHLPSLAREAALAARFLVRSRREPAAQGAHSRFHTARVIGPTFGSAALLLASRAAYERIGGFDQRYFLYLEDADLWVRMERSGAAVGFHNDVVAVHQFSAGSPAGSAERELLRWLGIELFAEKFWRSGHRALRALHRRVLSVGGREKYGEIGRRTDRLWSVGTPPARVLEELRPVLEGRRSL